MIRNLQAVILFLLTFLKRSLRKNLEPFRLAQASLFLARSGGSLISPILLETAKAISKDRQLDGGYGDVRETAFAVSYLSELEGYEENAEKGLEWLANEKRSREGWGYSRRDRTRIPVTALVHHLLPDLRTEESRIWMVNEWLKDRENKPLLSYKTAFVLIDGTDDATIREEMETALLSQQEENGGFGPWKSHPAGPDAWCTGIALLALAQIQTKEAHQAGIRALHYLKQTQCPQGFWPYHYLDTGAAWALYGMSSFIRSHNIRLTDEPEQ
jgi:hypothetical protein